MGSGETKIVDYQLSKRKHDIAFIRDWTKLLKVPLFLGHATLFSPYEFRLKIFDIASFKMVT